MSIVGFNGGDIVGFNGGTLISTEKLNNTNYINTTFTVISGTAKSNVIPGVNSLVFTSAASIQFNCLNSGSYNVFIVNGGGNPNGGNGVSITNCTFTPNVTYNISVGGSGQGSSVSLFNVSYTSSQNGGFLGGTVTYLTGGVGGAIYTSSTSATSGGDGYSMTFGTTTTYWFAGGAGGNGNTFISLTTGGGNGGKGGGGGGTAGGKGGIVYEPITNPANAFATNANQYANTTNSIITAGLGSSNSPGTAGINSGGGSTSRLGAASGIVIIWWTDLPIDPTLTITSADATPNTITLNYNLPTFPSYTTINDITLYRSGFPSTLLSRIILFH